MDKELDEIFLQRRYTNGQQTHKNMFPNISHWGMQIKTTKK